MASRGVLNLLNFDLAFARCPPAHKSELSKMWRNHFALQEKMNTLPETDKKIDFDSYEPKIDNKEFFAELKKAYESTVVPHPNYKPNNSRTDKKVNEILSTIDALGKKLNPNEARYLNLVRVPGSRQYRGDILMKGWRDWVDVKIAYFGYYTTREQDNAIRMTFAEYQEKSKKDAEIKKKQQLEKTQKRRELMEKFKTNLLSPLK